MLLAGPGFAGESWHNQVHDVVSGVLTAEILIARRMLTLPVTGSAAGPGVTPGQGAPVSQGG